MGLMVMANLTGCGRHLNPLIEHKVQSRADTYAHTLLPSVIVW
jgi:hypothetical protein